MGAGKAKQSTEFQKPLFIHLNCEMRRQQSHKQLDYASSIGDHSNTCAWQHIGVV